MTNSINIQARASGLGWKYYNSAKKKATEKEFSWSGLIISLAVAFFIVLACAQALSLIYQSITAVKTREKIWEQKIYRLENVQHLNIQAWENVRYLERKSLKPIA